jgi:hypothetical protein
MYCRLRKGRGVPRPRVRHQLAGLCLTFCILSLSGCLPGRAGVGPSTEPPEGAIVATPSATPAPTPEPSPDILLLGKNAYIDTQGLSTWADERSWSLDQAPVDTMEQWVSRSGLRAVILAGSEAPRQEAELFPTAVQVIVLDGAGLEPGERLSTVGEPGARRDQVGFLAGMMVGMATSTRSVGLLSGTGGEYEPVYRMGFIHGLRFACPRCGLVEDRADTSNPEVLEQERVDALLVLPGEGAVQAAERMMGGGIWVVWADIVPDEMSQSRLAGWVHFDATPLVIEALEAALAGGGGAAYPYSAETSGIAFQVSQPEAISPGRLGFIQRAWERMEDGDLDTGVDPITGSER